MVQFDKKDIVKYRKKEAAVGKRVFMKISQNPQKTTCVGVSFLIKLHALVMQFH